MLFPSPACSRAHLRARFCFAQGYALRAREREAVPVVIVRGEHHAGTGVGVAGDPRAVHGEHHQQHQHEHGDNGFDVGA